MTDLVERLRVRAGDERRNYYGSVDAELDVEAADEIERLLAACKDKADLLRYAYAQVDHLREEFERLERAYQQLRETYLKAQEP